jgi:hypothetical protein
MFLWQLKRKVVELTKDDDAGSLTHFITYVLDLILIISQNRMKVIQKSQYPQMQKIKKKNKKMKKSRF